MNLTLVKEIISNPLSTLSFSSYYKGIASFKSRFWHTTKTSYEIYATIGEGYYENAYNLEFCETMPLNKKEAEDIRSLTITDIETKEVIYSWRAESDEDRLPAELFT